MHFNNNLQFCSNQAICMVLATLGQATYRRLHEARKSYSKNPTSQVMDFSTNLQLCLNQAPHLLLATLGQATHMRLHETRLKEFYKNSCISK